MLKLETKLNRIWLGFLVFSLALPIGVLAQPAGQSFSKTANRPSPVISVIKQLPEVREVAVPETVATIACPGMAVSADEGNLVQKAANINLNYPAGCFAMKVGQIVPAARLAVLPLAQSLPAVSVAVPLAAAQIIPFAVLPAGQGSAIPALGLFVASLVLPHKPSVQPLGERARMPEPYNFIHIVSIYRLNIMRC